LPLAANHDATRLMALVAAKTPQRAARRLSGVQAEVAGSRSGVNGELGTRAGRRPMTMA